MEEDETPTPDVVAPEDIALPLEPDDVPFEIAKALVAPPSNAKSDENRVTIRMAPELHERVITAAKADGRSLNWLMCEAITRYLDPEAGVLLEATSIEFDYEALATQVAERILSKLQPAEELSTVLGVGYPPQTIENTD